MIPYYLNEFYDSTTTRPEVLHLVPYVTGASKKELYAMMNI